MTTRYLTDRGYVELSVPLHPRARHAGRVFEHIIVAEAALGKYLPPTAVVHHVDGDKTRNVGSNLVVCENQAYHLLLHRRQRAFEECGDPNSVQCYYCRAWARPEAFDGRRGKDQYCHRSCAAQWQRDHNAKRRGDRPKHLDMLATRPTCKHGHPWTDANTRFNAKGARWCLDCSRAADARRRAEKGIPMLWQVAS